MYLIVHLNNIHMKNFLDWLDALPAIGKVLWVVIHTLVLFSVTYIVRDRPNPDYPAESFTDAKADSTFQEHTDWRYYQLESAQ